MTRRRDGRGGPRSRGRGARSFRPSRLTAAQAATLGEIGRSRVRRFVGVGRGALAAIKALALCGLVEARWISSRAWDCRLTPAGRRALAHLPR